jgi:predicted DNA-binding antitoxin AbrB/MazE fold protein
MAREFRARFSKGKIEPLEKVDLREGEEFTVTIKEAPAAERTLKALRATAGAWKGTHDAEELKRNIYADRLISTRPEPKL